MLDAVQPHPDKKKIFVFCDGTGNEFAEQPVHQGKEANSNVVKLYTALRVTDKQVAYYHPGVGTMGDPTIRHRIPRFWSKVKGLAFGYGFKDNVLDAYRYLMNVYNDGDEIYVFGFSRGAYTARALTGMLHGYGLLCRGNEGHLLYAWNMFQDQLMHKRGLLQKTLENRRGEPAHSIEHNFAFAQTFSREVTIRFMGIWDTVSSVGWIYEPLRLLNMAQNPIIQVGRHAVSIDERRAFYRDNLWGPAIKGLTIKGIQQDIIQVWFPGVHSDVGGSYPQKEAAPANEALRWMIGEVQRHGAELCQERIDMVLGKASGVYAADVIYTPHPKQDHRIHDSLTTPWWLLQLFPQQYYDKEDGLIQWRVPYGTPRWIPPDAIIHHSAVRRLQSTVPGEKPYRPRNLELERCRPLPAPPLDTTADLTGCYVYEPSIAQLSKRDGTGFRMAKIVVGWLTFGLFLLLLAALAWLALCGLSFLLRLAIFLLLFIPGVRRLLHFVSSCAHWIDWGHRWLKL